LRPIHDGSEILKYAVLTWSSQQLIHTYVSRGAVTYWSLGSDEQHEA